MATILPTVRSFQAKRVRYDTRRAFDAVLADLRAAVGDATRGELAAAADGSLSKDDFETRMKKVTGDSDFMLFFELDHGAWLQTYGIHRNALRWVFGNPVIAYTMLRYDIIAGLFAPVEMLLLESEARDGTTIIYNLPSSLMVIDDNRPLLNAARSLDRKFAALIERVV
jgi:uncharacterized protein (DUF302 family)